MYLYLKNHFLCAALGKNVACCYDQEEKNVMGSFQGLSLKEIWNSDYYENLRSRIDNAEKEPDTDYICAKPPKMDKGAG
tara:strand:+ start:934 stop:1170 length:237 start_codon:yes stop_codon:yes gene_type:complete